MSASYEDFYGEPGPFDEEMERIKEHLRSTVKQEITEELERLRAENGEMKGKLKNLDQLEREAISKRGEYERKLARAEQEGHNNAQLMGLSTLITLLTEPRYRVSMTSTMGPKCGKCDEDRKLHYTTPRGRDAEEWCECHERTYSWEVEEQLVHEVSRRGGKLMAWYHSEMRYFDGDTLSSPTVLKSPEGLTLEEMARNPREYGFRTEEAAAVLAAAMNKEEEA